MPWYLQDERTPASERLFAHLSRIDFWLPSLWRLEFVNALNLARRRDRIDTAAYRAALEHAETLPLKVDEHEPTLREIAELATRHSLTAYDAAYLELARRRGLPLATLDDA